MDPELARSLRWPEDRGRLKSVQEEIRKEIRIVPLSKPPALVAGIDAAFAGDRIISVACLFTYPALEFLDESVSIRKLSFPYIPGYLSFREGPSMMDAITGLSTRPELLIIDGQGIAHPRGAGLASFVGVLEGLPAIGCAKTRLAGEYAEPGGKRGEYTPLVIGGEIAGAVLRTRDGVKPVFVSPGNLIDVESSVKVVLECSPRYRLTEPVRSADALTKKIKKGLMGK